MSDFDNVKLIIQDAKNNYLVGRRYGKQSKYSSLGGHRERGENYIQTMSRELLEETSGLLKILKQGKQYYISDKIYRYPINISDTFRKGKQMYVLIYFPFDLSEYISRWRTQFNKNQENLVFDEIENLHKRFPEVSVVQWFEYMLKFKDDYSELEKILKSREFTKPEIRRIVNEFEEIGYYLEMDDLDVVSFDELSQPDGLYEKDIIRLIQPESKYLNPKFVSEYKRKNK